MRKNLLLLVLSVLVFASDRFANAQQIRLHRVGVLVVGSPDIPEVNGFRGGLKEAGYIDGKNLILDISAKKTFEELRPIVKSYVEKKFDVIAAVGGTASLMAKEVTQEIPIVFIAALDPVAAGLVRSIAHPDGNVTGVARGTDLELEGKRLQVFTEVVPALRQVAALYNARGENPGHANRMAIIQKLAPRLGLKLSEKPIKTAEDIEPALSSLSRNTTDGLLVVCSSIFREPFKQIVEAAIQKKFALLACDAEHSNEQGALLYYDANRYRAAHRAAWYVDRILKGARPQNLPIESPTHFELIINVKTAKQIGLTIPSNVLARADRVIK